MTDERISRLLKDLIIFLKENRDRGVHYTSKESILCVQGLNNKIRKIRSERLLKRRISSLEQVSSLSSMEELVSTCTLCTLHRSRKKVVFGEGPSDPTLMVVGEAPGREEDLTGRPFVGKSGELLTKMLRAINIDRRDVFITSVIKCRPPGNRTPKSSEIDACMPYLMKQIEFLNPRLILCLGATAAGVFTGKGQPLSETRGKFFDLNGRKMIATYHPAFLLRFSGSKQIALKRQAWHDLQMLQREYETIVTHKKNEKKE